MQSSIVILELGLNLSIFLSRSMESEGAPGN